MDKKHLHLVPDRAPSLMLVPCLRYVPLLPHQKSLLRGLGYKVIDLSQPPRPRLRLVSHEPVPGSSNDAFDAQYDLVLLDTDVLPYDPVER